ncbi:MAG: acetoin utilization protein AcuC [Coriobacteriia bacterium]
MRAALVFSAEMAAYDFGTGHPLRPERVTRSVALMRAYGLTDGMLEPVRPDAASDGDLERVHTSAYIAAVTAASRGDAPAAGFGIGPGDNPAFPGMHEAAALIAGGGVLAMDLVHRTEYRRAFSVAGGLHHALADRAAGFCVYNDVAVAIAAAIARDPALRVAYVDIDAHHGDGVQWAFYDEPRVLTVSVHQSGERLFPGTGFSNERGYAAGVGSSVNVPLPAGATDACMRLAFDEVVAPAVRRFGPDILVSQNGADSHWSDPLTMLRGTLRGYRSLVHSIAALAEEVCDGRLVAFGGGGYAWEHVVPRAWTMLAASLTRTELPARLPECWLEAHRVPGVALPETLAQDAAPPAPDEDRVLAETRRTIAQVRSGPPFA